MQQAVGDGSVAKGIETLNGSINALAVAIGKQPAETLDAKLVGIDSRLNTTLRLSCQGLAPPACADKVREGKGLLMSADPVAIAQEAANLEG